MPIAAKTTNLLLATTISLLLPLTAGAVQKEKSPHNSVPPARLTTAEDLSALSIGLTTGKPVSAVGAAITTSSDQYDGPVAKLVPASAFIPTNGPSLAQDAVIYDEGRCIYPDPGNLGTVVSLYAPVELPTGALLEEVIFLGSDTSAEQDMAFSIQRAEVAQKLVIPPGPIPIPSFEWSQEKTTLVEGSTAGLSGIGGVTLDVDPDDVTGWTGIFGGRFYTLSASFSQSAGDATTLCGAIVLYKVPSTGQNQTFTPVTPCKIYDSRPQQGGSGVFTSNEIRTITVTGDTPAQGGTPGGCGIPHTASAVQLNFVIVDPLGTGSIKLWAPSSAEPQGLLAYQSGLISFWNGSGTVPISTLEGSEDKQMRVKTNGAGAHVVLSVTGYTSSVANMAN